MSPNFKKLIFSVKQTIVMYAYIIISDLINDEYVCVEIRSGLRYYTLKFPQSKQMCFFEGMGGEEGT